MTDMGRGPLYTAAAILAGLPVLSIATYYYFRWTHDVLVWFGLPGGLAFAFTFIIGMFVLGGVLTAVILRAIRERWFWEERDDV